ncbi:N-acetyltransferase [Hoeflea prorocentri]|uniref:N-acetyltransferase n=2 Tax=Hoeflea prorocentri TaxID=1922333 RepID=A0A9X3UKZ4_9HYPH|nr:N-acetyltransferase [Hoeflea prorocentri]MCY6382765.1 N-acetyltransferase [Hoeflea prorocentri]MDA5400565.1 N-acetyltransferase [Hoeflea prorocentri]
MTPADCAEASIRHSEGFSRPWTDGEIEALLVQEPVFGFVARRPGKWQASGGFVLARLVEGEAEILTLAVRPKNRRSGIGWRLMGAVLRHLRSEGAECLFLEVDEGNEAALSLYRRIGFTKVAERAAYYDEGGGARTAALVMRLDLG